MKRVGYLYQKIYSLENLRLADKNAQKGKRNKKDIIKHNTNNESNILELQKMLINKTFKNSKYNTFIIFDKKERIIFSLPYYPDRILQHAILQIISPILLKSFISQTYSCIPGKGIHKCLFDVKKALKDENNTLYTLKLDIKKYYPSVDKFILKSLLNRKFKDKDLLIILFKIINSNKNGLPIGNYLSQYLGNFYLYKFDKWLKQDMGVKYYFRYMDDMVILHSDKKYLHNLKCKIENYLSDNLKLELSKYQIYPTNSRGVDFVGYKLFHTHILIRKSIKNNFIKMIKYNYNKKSIDSYKGWLKWCNSKNLQNKYIKTKTK